MLGNQLLPAMPLVVGSCTTTNEPLEMLIWGGFGDAISCRPTVGT